MHLTVFQLIDQLIELIDQDKKSTADTVLFHGAYGVRTRDLHAASVARSQLR